MIVVYCGGDDMTVNGRLSGFDMLALLITSMNEDILMWVNGNDTFDILLNILHDNGFTYAHKGAHTFDIMRGTNNITYSITVKVGTKVNIKIYNIFNVLSRSTKKRIDRSFNGSSLLQILTNIATEYKKNGIASPTAASAAMTEYKKLRGYGEYAKLFPDLPLWKTDIRQSYVGGIVYAKQGEYHNGASYDCNSLYPTALVDNPMPIYAPEHYDGEYRYDGDMPLHIDRVTFRAELLDGCIPYGHVIWGDLGTDDGTDGYVTRWMSDVDMVTLKRYYDVSVIRTIEGYKFHTAKGLFTAYVDDWYERKSHANDAKRDIAKIMLNSLIGKFGVYPRDSRMVPMWRDGVMTWRIVKEESQSKSYPPIAIMVAAYARQVTLAAMHANIGHLIYADTDSVILDTQSEPKGIEIDDDRRGAWKRKPWCDMRILGPRRYATRDMYGNESMNLAGVPLTTVIPYDDFVAGKHVNDDNGYPFVL